VRDRNHQKHVRAGEADKGVLKGSKTKYLNWIILFEKGAQGGLRRKKNSQTLPLQRTQADWQAGKAA